MTEPTLTSGQLPSPSEAMPADESPYGAVFDRLLQEVPALEEKIAIGRLRGDLQLAHLMGLSRQERLGQVFTNPSLHHDGFVDVCCARVQALLAGRPKSALLVAEVALYSAWAVRNASDGRRSDLRARTFRLAAEAMSRCGMTQEALLFLTDAQRFQEETNADPLEQAALLEARAYRERCVGERENARQLLAEARAVYRRLEDFTGEGRTLLAEARLLGVEEPAAAVELCRQALASFEPSTDAALVARAHLQLGWHLTDANRPGDALRVLASAGYWLALLRKADRLRHLWLEARIALRLDFPQEAAGGLARAVEGWRSLRRYRAVALASIDLAEALFALGDRSGAAEALLDGCEVLEKRKCLSVQGVDRWVEVANALADGEPVEAGAFRELSAGIERGWYLAAWKSAAPPTGPAPLL